MFDLKSLKKETVNNKRYERRLAQLLVEGREVEHIKSVVEKAHTNLDNGQKSFVIYGEPQSGKTEMMIALTAKLLDDGYKIIVILLNDSVQLLDQNLERFQRSGLSPAPKKFSEILPNDITIGEHQWVIFSKKNSKDLQKLIQKLHGHFNRVIIDDEADYATPNSKINKKEKSKINELTGDLIGRDGIYIGVTATPARLDLNRTHDNLNESWIDFPTHSNYTGQDIFFPSNSANLQYNLTLLPDQGNGPKYIRDSLFSFFVNVGFLNTVINPKEENYSCLIHTSGKMADHTVDYKEVIKMFEVLRDESNPYHEKYFEQIWKISNERYHDHADAITRYIIENNDRNNTVVMNSDKEKNVADNRTATDPTAPFTVIIGGNIVSRGVTFKNLLSMFFTRDVKHTMQQDTYIQRARMFGSRGPYLKYFELTIPNALYLNWQQCFIFHRLSLESRKQDKKSPIWLEGNKISAAAKSSVDKARVVVDQGEMSFDIFDYDPPEVENIIRKAGSSIQKLKALSEVLGKTKLPPYLISYIESFRPAGEASIAIHEPKSIVGSRDASTDQESITRTKGFIGKSQLNEFPDAVHHIFVLYNNNNKARVFYKYKGSIKFLKTTKQYG